MLPTPGFIVKHSFLELEAEARPARSKLRRVYSDGVLQIINRLQSHSRHPTGDVFKRPSMPKVVGPEEMPAWWLGQRYGKKEMLSEDSTSYASSAASSVTGDDDHVGNYTTLRISNLPAEYNQQFFAQTLDKEGFAGFYDFLFVPLDFRSNLCDGIAIVNFRSSATAMEALQLFQSFSTWLVDCQQVATASWNEYDQGLNDLVERYKNSPLMHRNVPEIFKPMLFNAFGEIVPFPAPTRKVRKPRKRAIDPAMPSCEYVI